MRTLLAAVLGVSLGAAMQTAPIMNLQGRVDANNALVVSGVVAGTLSSVGAIANLQGKVDSNNSLLVTLSSILGAEGASAVLTLSADDGDDTNDVYTFTAADAAGGLTIANNSESVKLAFTSNVATVSSATGVTSLVFTSIVPTLLGAEGASASLVLSADEADDANDVYTLAATDAAGGLSLTNNSEDLKAAFTSNVVTFTSSTSVATAIFSGIAVQGDHNSSDGTVGLTQTCVAAVTAVTVKDGLITAITCP